VLLIGALIVVNAILRAFFDPVANALVADLSPPEQRVAAFSLQRVGINIGWAAGPASAALASYSTLFYVAAGLSVLATYAVAHIHEPPPSASARPPSWREMLALREDRILMRFLLATIAFFILQVQLYQALSIYAARDLHLDRAQVGRLYSINGLMVVLLQVGAVGYIRRVGLGRALVIGCLGYAVSYVSVGFATGFATLLLSVAAITLAEMVSAPAQQASIAALAPAGRIGTYVGLFGLCQVVGQSAGPLIGGAMLDARPARIAWFVLPLFGLVAAFTYRRSTSR
jgi:MFS family permease